MIASVVAAALYATTWVDNRIVISQGNSETTIIETLEASLANARTAIVTDVGTRISASEQSLRTEIKQVDDRLFGHISGHATGVTVAGPWMAVPLDGEGRRVEVSSLTNLR